MNLETKILPLPSTTSTSTVPDEEYAPNSFLLYAVTWNTMFIKMNMMMTYKIIKNMYQMKLHHDNTQKLYTNLATAPNINLSSEFAASTHDKQTKRILFSYEWFRTVLVSSFKDIGGYYVQRVYQTLHLYPWNESNVDEIDVGMTLY